MTYQSKEVVEAECYALFHSKPVQKHEIKPKKVNCICKFCGKIFSATHRSGMRPAYCSKLHQKEYYKQKELERLRRKS